MKSRRFKSSSGSDKRHGAWTAIIDIDNLRRKVSNLFLTIFKNQDGPVFDTDIYCSIKNRLGFTLDEGGSDIDIVKSDDLRASRTDHSTK